jgi:hypothetical protein
MLISPGHAFQAGDHPQQGRLAAARGSDKHHKPAIRNIDINAVNVEFLDPDVRHAAPVPWFSLILFRQVVTQVNGRVYHLVILAC